MINGELDIIMENWGINGLNMIKGFWNRSTPHWRKSLTCALYYCGL
jgi:hypothetical protein